MLPNETSFEPWSTSAFGYCAKKSTFPMVRENPDGSNTPLTMPNHPRIKSSTLRTICTQAGISREEFLAAYESR
jgi:hypothetical protein